MTAAMPRRIFGEFTVANAIFTESARPFKPEFSPLLAPVRARTYTIRMGQQLRIRAKRKRRKSYVERRKAKQKAAAQKPAKPRGRKEAAS
jgi:hypothetical protein